MKLEVEKWLNLKKAEFDKDFEGTLILTYGAPDIYIQPKIGRKHMKGLKEIFPKASIILQPHYMKIYPIPSIGITQLLEQPKKIHTEELYAFYETMRNKIVDFSVKLPHHVMVHWMNWFKYELNKIQANSLEYKDIQKEIDNKRMEYSRP